jgi:hypothetical protein
MDTEGEKHANEIGYELSRAEFVSFSDDEIVRTSTPVSEIREPSRRSRDGQYSDLVKCGCRCVSAVSASDLPFGGDQAPCDSPRSSHDMNQETLYDIVQVWTHTRSLQTCDSPTHAHVSQLTALV